jgi:hypothetical protein
MHILERICAPHRHRQHLLYCSYMHIITIVASFEQREKALSFFYQYEQLESGVWFLRRKGYAVTTSGSTSAIRMVHSVGGIEITFKRFRVVSRYGTRRGFLAAVY